MMPLKYIKAIPYGEDAHWLPLATLRWGPLDWRYWYKAVRE